MYGGELPADLESNVWVEHWRRRKMDVMGTGGEALLYVLGGDDSSHSDQK